MSKIDLIIDAFEYDVCQEILRLEAVQKELLEALKAFDNAAKESKSIVAFAGRSLKLLAQSRATIAKAEDQA